jgi:hypothetical protein
LRRALVLNWRRLPPTFLLHTSGRALARTGTEQYSSRRERQAGQIAIVATAVFAGLALVISISAEAFASPAAFLLLLGGAGAL